MTWTVRAGGIKGAYLVLDTHRALTPKGSPVSVVMGV